MLICNRRNLYFTYLLSIYVTTTSCPWQFFMTVEWSFTWQLCHIYRHSMDSIQLQCILHLAENTVTRHDVSSRWISVCRKFFTTFPDKYNVQHWIVMRAAMRLLKCCQEMVQWRVQIWSDTFSIFCFLIIGHCAAGCILEHIGYCNSCQDDKAGSSYLPYSVHFSTWVRLRVGLYIFLDLCSIKDMPMILVKVSVPHSLCLESS